MRRLVAKFSSLVFLFLLYPGCTTLPSQKIIKEAQTRQSEIKRLENYLKKNPDTFDWKAHNELRHLYSEINPRKSMEHADIILKYSVMDGYILSILSGWELDKNPDKAIINLLSKVESYPDLLFIKAACWDMVGNIFSKQNRREEAKSYYQKVIDTSSQEANGYIFFAKNQLNYMDTKMEIQKSPVPSDGKEPEIKKSVPDQQKIEIQKSEYQK